MARAELPILKTLSVFKLIYSLKECQGLRLQILGQTTLEKYFAFRPLYLCPKSLSNRIGREGCKYLVLNKGLSKKMCMCNWIVSWGENRLNTMRQFMLIWVLNDGTMLRAYYRWFIEKNNGLKL